MPIAHMKSISKAPLCLLPWNYLKGLSPLPGLAGFTYVISQTRLCGDLDLAEMALAGFLTRLESLLGRGTFFTCVITIDTKCRSETARLSQFFLRCEHMGHIICTTCAVT